MPVSFLPLLFPALMLGVPLGFLIKKGRKAFFRAAAVSASFLAFLFLWVYVPGWILMAKVRHGDPRTMYELARWTEKHDKRIGEFILWPVSPNVLGGYAWLEKAAAGDYPPAIYALGVRLKYGYGVPRPSTWLGPEEYVFPQPERGQALIDKALRLGYRPPVREENFYYFYRE